MAAVHRGSQIDMEKRVVIFLVLSLAVILGYDLLLKQLGLLPSSPTVQEQSNQESDTTRTETGTPAEKKIDTTPISDPLSTSPKAGSSSAAQTASVLPAEHTITLDTNLLRVGFDAQGGVISSWELKQYRTAPPEQKPVQLVYQGAKFRGPLSITTSNPAADKALREGLYAIDTDFGTLDTAHPTGHVTLRLEDPASGLKVQKRLTFHHDNYLVDVALTIEGLTGGYEVVLGTNFGIVEWGDGFIGLIGSASLVDGKVENIGLANRNIVGTWTVGTTKNDFRLVRQ